MFKEFIKKIKNYHHVGVISHIRPDGDCIGSQVAICRWLEANGLQATAFNDDDVPPNIKWLLNYHPVEKPDETKFEKCDLFIAVDGNAIHRFGMFADWYEKQSEKPPLWMIDHHPNPEDSFDLMISVENAASTAELIFKLYVEQNPDQIDEQIAKALYTGIITDTGSLQFESVTPETVQTVAELLRRGNFRPNEVIEVIYSNKSVAQYKLLSAALETIQLFENNQIAVMSVTDKMLADAGASPSDCEGFVSYPLSLSETKAAVLMKDFFDDGVRISLRSRSDIDVNVWARELGGGGHKKAAGAWHEGPLENAIHDVVKIGAKQLKDIETTSVL
jgi:bifunctional oligoribonuclease and PAP phosphatase NrnA